MKHRSPDETDFFEDAEIKLGMGRLKIFDLESPGLCPLVTDSYVLLYNGEIYNWKELKKELQASGHIFKTQSDTEVLLASYAEWGEGCLEKLNGMFAFVIYDRKDHILFGARDIAGEKPLYYYHDGSDFIFASEIKAILKEIVSEPNLHEQFLAMEVSTRAETLFKGIYNLLPAHKFIYDLRTKKLKIERYYDVLDNLRRIDPRSAVDELEAILKDAIGLRMRSDVPVGLYLSGGLDSALIATIAEPKIVFSCRFDDPDFDEIEYAELIAKHIGAEHVVVRPTKEDFEDDLEKIIWHLDMPTGSYSSFPLFELAKTARGYVKVVLSGEGADELFGGYYRYLPIWWEEALKEKEESRNYQPMLDFYFGPTLYRYAKISARDPGKRGNIERLLRPYWVFDDLVNNMTYADFNLILPSLLQMGDRMASAFGLENRSPFLDRRLIEFAFSLPGDMKIRNLVSKWILREVAKRYLPAEIVERRDKKGLVMPYNSWYNSSGRLGVFDRAHYNSRMLEAWKKVMAG